MMLFLDRITKADHCSKYVLYLLHSNPMHFSVSTRERGGEKKS